MAIASYSSRRLLLKIAGFAAFQLASGGPGFSAPAATQKISKADANYRERPNGIQRCEICLQFRPPNRCNLVDGDISPKGWCQYFAGRENAE